jgi:hypothetical protein
VTTDGFWIGNRICWTIKHTIRDYTLQITVTQRLVFPVTVLTALLGNIFQQIQLPPHGYKILYRICALFHPKVSVPFLSKSLKKQMINSVPFLSKSLKKQRINFYRQFCFSKFNISSIIFKSQCYGESRYTVRHRTANIFQAVPSPTFWKLIFVNSRSKPMLLLVHYDALKRRTLETCILPATASNFWRS